MHIEEIVMKYFFVLLTIVSLSLTGCASITRGTKDNFAVTSTPSGAQVKLSNGFQCSSTPCYFEIKRRSKFTVEVSKAGCQTVTVPVENELATEGVVAGAGNVILGGVIGLGVDAVTGANFDLEPNPVNVNLDCG